MPTRLASLLARAAGSSRRTRLAALALLAAAGAAAVYTAPRQQAALRPAVRQAVPAQAAPSSAAPVRLAPAPRRIYPYSIVPGGVADRDELAQAIKADKVVAEHYAGFDVDQARPLTVSRPRAVYVSYRKGDKVYWTRNKLALAEGEILLTDGRHELRARCANRISDTPMLPVAADEPGQVEFDASGEEGSVQEVSMAPIEDPGFDGEPFQLRTFASMVAEAPLDATRSSSGRLRFSQPGRMEGSRPALPVSLLGSNSMSTTGMSSAPAPESSRSTIPGAAVPSQGKDGDAGLPEPAQSREDPSPFIPAPALSQPELPYGGEQDARLAEVPEPATLLLGGLAGAAMHFLRRRNGTASRTAGRG